MSVKDYYKQASRNKKIKSKKLNEKQKLFADYYIELNNASKSYTKAYGVEGRTAEANGHKLLKQSHIKLYIEERLKQKDKKRIMQQDEILELLTKHARGKTVEECLNVISVSKEESEVVKNTKQIIPKDQLKALELLGKRYGTFDLAKQKYNETVKMNKHKINIDNEKLKIEKEKLKQDEVNNNDNQKVIEEFLKATRPSKTDLDELFEDDI